jgi:phosphatidylserine synthase
VPYPSFKHVHVGLGGRALLLAVAAGVIVLAWKTRTSVVLLAMAATYVILGPADWVLHLPARLIRWRRRVHPDRERDEVL